MKKKILKLCAIIITIFILYKLVYKPFIRQIFVKIDTQHLQVGSYIFTSEMRHIGSQTFEMEYNIFRVMEIKDDYVRLSIVREFNTSKNVNDGYFLADKYIYENAVDSINKAIITPILSEDIPDWNDLILNDFLTKKYPSLLKSRLFVEDVSNNIKATIQSSTFDEKLKYFYLVYSKKEIMANARLVRYGLMDQNNGIPVLFHHGENIELIINKK